MSPTAAEALAIPHELDDMPPKVLRELSAAEFELSRRRSA